MPANSTITGEMSATEVSEALGTDLGTLRAMVRAESYGSAMVGRVRIVHKGYERNAVEFNAGTSIYQLSY
jgi:hypothetical protein